MVWCSILFSCDKISQILLFVAVFGVTSAVLPPEGRCPEKFACSNRQCIAFVSVCDGKIDCEDETDELPALCDLETGSYECTSGYQQCTSSRQCVPDTAVCDYIAQCPGASDELGCVCKSGDSECPDGRCLHQEMLCDGVKDCSDGSDENNCAKCQLYMNGTVTGFSGDTEQLGAGGKQLLTISDTRDRDPCKLLIRVKTNSKGGALMVAVSVAVHHNPIKHFRAYQFDVNRGRIIARGQGIRGGMKIRTPHLWKKADGSVEIEIKGNRTTGWVMSSNNCSYGSVITLTAEPLLEVTIGKELTGKMVGPCGKGCPVNQLTCPEGGGCISVSHVCDGKDDCLGGVDEHAALCDVEEGEHECPEKYARCPGSRRCIPEEWLCNGRVECLHQSEELQCDCPEGHFQCLVTGLCVPTAVKCDGFHDCGPEDISDEANCTDIDSPNVPSG